MRTLPQAPNLDFLKRQAKEVLAALRETDPGARLSDAQRSLAELHGFRTWTELKAAVERARNKPQLFDAEIAAQIAKAFDLGETAGPAVLVATDVGGPIVRLATDSGTWKAHRLLRWATSDLMEDSARLMDAAASAGVKAPRAVRTPTGSLVEEIAGEKWHVDTWIDLGPTVATPVSSAISTRAGALLATMHGLRLEPAGEMNPWLAAKPRAAEDWHRMLATVEEHGAPWASALAGAIPAILDVSAGHADAPGEGLVLAHTDFQPATTHLDLNDALAPTGWEFAGAITPAWHLGLVLDAWTTTPGGELNEAAARAIVAGYASVAGDVPELDLSIFSPVITAWLNWLVSRMNVALQGTDDQRADAEREVAGMLANPKDRGRFERLLRAAGAR